MSATVQFNSTTQWNANTRVLFFDYNSEQVVSSTGALVADSDSARNAAAQTPTGDPGSVAIPTGTTPGTYYAYAYVGPTLATTDSPEYSWGDTLPLSWDGINLIYGPTVPTPTTGAYPLNVGANQGISGDVVFPTFSGVWRFTVYVVGDSWDLDAINDAGRGDGRWPASIPGSAHGMVTLTGKITRQACPNPTTLNGQLLTVTRTLYTGITETMIVRVLKRGVSKQKPYEGHDRIGDTGENYDITITAQIVDMPVSAGWPDQTTSEDDTYDDKIQWEGILKTGDVNTIADDAKFTLRVYPIAGDTDSAEVALLISHYTDLLTGVSVFENLKLLPIKFRRQTAQGQTADGLGYLDFTFARKDTADELTIPETQSVVDQSKLGTEVTVSEIGGTPTAPTVSGQTLVKAKSITKPVYLAGPNGGTELDQTTDQYKQGTTQQLEHEFPGTVSAIDPSGLESKRTETTVIATATPIQPPTAFLTILASGVPSTVARIDFAGANLPATVTATAVGGGGSGVTLTPTVTGTTLSALGVSGGTGYTASPYILFTGTGIQTPAATAGLKPIMGAAVRLNLDKTKYTFDLAAKDPQDEQELGSPWRPHTYWRENADHIGSMAELGRIDCEPPATTLSHGGVSGDTLVRVMWMIHPVVTDGNRQFLRYLHRATYAMIGTADGIAMRGTSASASIEAPAGAIDHQSIVAACNSTDTVATFIAADETTYANTAGYAGVTTKRLSPTERITMVKRVNDDLSIWEGEPVSTEREQGTDVTGAYVKIKLKFTYGSGQYIYKLGGFTVNFTTKTVVIRRRKTGITNLDGVRFRGYENTCNNAAFDGYPQGTLKFRGARLRGNIGKEGSTHTQAYDLVFSYRSIGWFDPSIVKPGDNVPSTYSATEGGTPALNALRSGWAVTSLGQANFGSGGANFLG